MKNVLILLCVAVVVGIGFTMLVMPSSNHDVVSNDVALTVQEEPVQTLEFKLQCVSPVGFKREDTWYLTPEHAFFLRVGDTTRQFRHFEVPDTPLLADLPRDVTIGRNVAVSVMYTGGPDDRSFAKCELLSFAFTD